MKKSWEEIKEIVCNDYCRFPYTLEQEHLYNICETCILDRIDMIKEALKDEETNNI